MKLKYFLMIVLLSALIVAAGCAKPLAGQAVSGFSNVGCVEGTWFYEVNGELIGRDSGCTTMNDQGQFDTENPWCPTQTIEKDGNQVYVSGSGTWQWCSKEEIAQEESTGTEEQGNSEEEMAVEGVGYGGNEPVKCKDSDGGLNYNEKGTLTNPDGEIYEDFCSLGSVGSAGAGVKKDSSDYVYEYYCMDEKKAGTVIGKCMGGCVDGKCAGKESKKVCTPGYNGKISCKIDPEVGVLEVGKYQNEDCSIEESKQLWCGYNYLEGSTLKMDGPIGACVEPTGCCTPETKSWCEGNVYHQTYFAGTCIKKNLELKKDCLSYQICSETIESTGCCSPNVESWCEGNILHTKYVGTCIPKDNLEKKEDCSVIGKTCDVIIPGLLAQCG